MKCFVIQPFDKGKFDTRYLDVFKPAIIAAGLEPDRADVDSSADILIERIEQGIRESHVCFAEITLNNANVWFEVGYASACGKPICLVCSDERTDAYPFDVRHRKIINYQTRSTSDFDAGKAQITERLKALTAGLVASSKPDASVVSLGQRDGLSDHEIAALGAIAVHNMEVTFGMSGTRLTEEMRVAHGFTKIAAVLAVQSLLAAGLIRQVAERDYDGSEFIGYMPTPLGTNWLLRNQASLRLRSAPPTSMNADEIPF
jgi:hypothetical protein